MSHIYRELESTEEICTSGIINVYNEWDPVEEILVGSPLYARIPGEDESFTAVQRAAKDLLFCAPGPFPQQIIDETEEDIGLFIEELEKLNIKVRRPSPIKPNSTFKTGDWESDPFFCYCPRDVLLAFADTIIETPNVFRSRYFETFAYRDIMMDYLDKGGKWISAPKPRLLDSTYQEGTDRQLALRNTEPVFDAANVLRAGEDLFYLVSDSGNELGAKWLQNTLGNQFRVHLCHNLYSSVHIDSTLSLLRPGLVLVNPARVTEANLPSPLKKWEQLIAPPMIEYKYSAHEPFSSPWLGMNLLMLRPDLAVVDKHQAPLIQLLEKNGINVIPLLLRHGRTLGGGFHCITLDVRRKGKLENYFS
jgi:glycine amidinotransferase